MKQFSFKSIRTRLAFWFLLLTLIPLIFVIIITYFQRVGVMENETFDKLIAIRDLKVERLQDWLNERVSDMHVISEHKELTDLEFVLKGNSVNQNNKILTNSRRILNRYLNNYSLYKEIFIINPNNGKIMVSTTNYTEGEDKSNDEYFTKPMQSRELSIKDIYYSKTFSEYTMTYSIPIFCSVHNSEHIVGILVARIDLNNSLYPLLLRRVGLGKTGETLIVNKNSMALNELRWYNNAPLNLYISAEPVVKAVKGETGIAITKDYRGEDILAAYTYIPETKWGFVCKQDLKELNIPIREMVWNFIIIFIIVSIVILIIALNVSKSVSKPVIELNTVAQKIRSGDFSGRNTIILDDEMGALALAFNNMADAIESRIKIQKEISDISGTMIKQSTLKEYSTSVLKHMMEITGANTSVFYILNETTSKYEHFISFGISQELLKPFNVGDTELEFANTLSEKDIYYLQDLTEDIILKYKLAGDEKAKEIINIPVLIDNEVIALISLVNTIKFNKESYEVLKQSQIGLNSSFSSLLSNERTRILAESLARINQQLETQSKKLQDQSEELQEQTEELKLTSEKLHVQNSVLETKNIKISESRQAMTYLLEDMNQVSVQLQKSNEQLEMANNELEAFSYSVSHDLRAPLRAIDGFTRILMEDYVANMDAEGKRLGSVIQHNAKKMGKLIDDLLTFSRMGRTIMNLSKIDMSNMTNAIYHEASNAKERKHIDFKVSDLHDADGDPNLIRHVWMNLISNSIKFSNKKKKAIISISCKEEENKLTYCIKDNGVGFDMKYSDKLFGVFQRLHSEKEFEGTGVGLALVQRIIKRHGGEVFASGEIDKGAEFCFSLPIKKNS